jgi:hypothetical protein
VALPYNTMLNKNSRYAYNSYWYGGQYQDIQTAHGPYHDPRAVCLSWYCTPYQ